MTPPAPMSNHIVRSLTHTPTHRHCGRNLKVQMRPCPSLCMNLLWLLSVQNILHSQGGLDPLAFHSLHCITKCSHFGSRRARDRAPVASPPHSHHWACNETMDFLLESWHLLPVCCASSLCCAILYCICGQERRDYYCSSPSIIFFPHHSGEMVHQMNGIIQVQYISL